MNLNKLIDVLNYLNNEINSHKLIATYNKLLNLMYAYELDRNDIVLKDIEQEKKKILKFHNDFKNKTWSESQNDVIDRLNKDGLLGKLAIENFNKIFKTFKDNPKDAGDKIQISINEINSLLKEISVLLKSLEPILTSTNDLNDENLEDNNLLIIKFKENSFFQNINLLEKFCRIWSKIIMSFMYLTKEDIKPAYIESISKDYIIFFLEKETIETLTNAAYEVLKGYKKVIEVRRLQLEIESINLTNKEELRDLLEDEVLNIVDILSSQVTYELISQFNWEAKPKKNELHKSIQISLKQIVNFIEKGGSIESKNSRELNKLNEKIIVILNNIKELEDNNNYNNKEFYFDVSFEEDEVEKFD